MERDLLPGYAAIFRHPNDELNFCTYIIPGGKAVPSDLKAMHHDLLENKRIIRRHLGSSYTIEPMKGAWLRLGGASPRARRTISSSSAMRPGASTPSPQKASSLRWRAPRKLPKP